MHDLFTAVCVFVFVVAKARGEYKGVHPASAGSSKWRALVYVRYVYAGQQSQPYSTRFQCCGSHHDKERVAREHDKALLELTGGQISSSKLNFPAASRERFSRNQGDDKFQNVADWLEMVGSYDAVSTFFVLKPEVKTQDRFSESPHKHIRGSHSEIPSAEYLEGGSTANTAAEESAPLARTVRGALWRIKHREENMVICGSAGTGKTQLLRSEMIPILH